MELRNTFVVPGSADDAFASLVDLEQVAPCMPGAELTGRDGDAYAGRLKLRIGPITVGYEGTVTVAASDPAARTATLEATGTELGGSGGASATVTATVTELDTDRSEVEVVTDLDIRGKAAQFGRGALGEVTQRVLDQFARNLEATFEVAPDGGGTLPTASASPTSSSSAAPVAPATPGPASAMDAELDVLRTVALPMLKRAAPALAAFVVGVAVGRLVRRPAPPTAAWGPPPWWSSPPPG